MSRNRILNKKALQKKGGGKKYEIDKKDPTKSSSETRLEIVTPFLSFSTRPPLHFNLCFHDL